MSTELLPGTIHELPADMHDALQSNTELLQLWNGLTPLARNEWICWVTMVKKQETRDDHVRRMQEEILRGKKRPCCWPGCPHHNPSKAKWFK